MREALSCFTSMSCALKERFTDKIAKLCNDVSLRGKVQRSSSRRESRRT